MIEFANVSREFRSLVARRRELQTLLGSFFAGLGLFLQNTLQGNLPDSLGPIRRHVFAFYAVVLMVPSLILALRMARLQAGMVLNGILFARLTRERDFAGVWSVEEASRLNFTGMSFLQFAVMDLIAGFSTAVLALALEAPTAGALGAGAGLSAAWLALYLRFHRQAVRFAKAKAAADPCAPFGRDEWEAHLSGSLEDANHDMNAQVAFVGLIVFSVFETLTGLGQIKGGEADLAPDLVRRHGPTAYVALMLAVCLMGLVANLRVRVAIGRFSILLDPSDRPLRPFRLTDSLLAYLIVAFLTAVSLHLLLGLLVPALGDSPRTLLAIDLGALLLAVAAEQVTLVVAGRKLGGAGR